MPRHIASLSDWRVLKIDIRDALCGDLLFVKSTERKILLSHAALFIKTNQIFHCSLFQQRAAIETEQEFLSRYEQELTFKEMISYIDIRNVELRAKYQGIFVE